MDKIKAFFQKHQDKMFKAVFVVLVGIVSFGAGRYSKIEREVPINIYENDEILSQKVEASNNDQAIDAEILGKYVGSLQGSVYYLATQAKIAEIGESKLIWFDTKEDAEGQGYQEYQSTEDAAVEDEDSNTDSETGKYVASKNGTKYYLPSCSGANRIKEENKVYFDSVEEAQAAGLEPAANCPGLDVE